MPRTDRNSDPDLVITNDGRLAGCRGRVLIGLALVAVLFILLCIVLVWGMDEESQPIPAPARTPPEAPAS